MAIGPLCVIVFMRGLAIGKAKRSANGDNCFNFWSSLQQECFAGPTRKKIISKTKHQNCSNWEARKSGNAQLQGDSIGTNQQCLCSWRATGPTSKSSASGTRFSSGKKHSHRQWFGCLQDLFSENLVKRIQTWTSTKITTISIPSLCMIWKALMAGRHAWATRHSFSKKMRACTRIQIWNHCRIHLHPNIIPIDWKTYKIRLRASYKIPRAAGSPKLSHCKKRTNFSFSNFWHKVFVQKCTA